VNRLRVHEGDLEPEHPVPWLVVDQLGAAGREIGDRSANVVDLVRDVMHPRAALRQELPDGRVVAERREQLDPVLADADRCSLDTLIVHAGAVLEAAAEEALVRAHRFVEIRDGDADVVDSSCFHPGDATGTVSRLRMGRRFSTGLIALAVLATAAAGCGGGGSSSNGEATKPAAAVFSDARQAALAASSVHVAGAVSDQGTSLKLDLVLAHGKGKGRIAEGGLSFQIVRVGNVAYIKGTDAFLRQFAGAAAAQLFHDKWLKGPVGKGVFASLAPLTDIGKLFNGAFGTHGHLTNKGETTYKGQKVVAIKDSGDGSTLYVAAGGTPYPVAAIGGGAAKGSLAFDHWNDAISIDAPKGAVDISKLGG
jgi:hypothetical protein